MLSKGKGGKIFRIFLEEKRVENQFSSKGGGALFYFFVGKGVLLGRIQVLGWVSKIRSWKSPRMETTQEEPKEQRG